MSSEKKRILFVDDESLVLQGLQRMLRGMRDEWEMEFVESGVLALARMGEVPFDVIISDMKMPTMNGTELLNEVLRRHPRCVRFILSGHADRELIFQCVGSTHQYLSKPCGIDLMKSAIARATALQGVFQDRELRALVARTYTLNSLPSLYTEMMTCLQSSEVSMLEVGEIIGKDIAMTAQVLKIVNSAFFGMPRAISSPSEAASYLGADILKALVLSAHLFNHYEAGSPGADYAESLWSHSMETAAAAKAIAQAEGADDLTIKEAFVAGMLHDVGKLVLDANFATDYRRVRATGHELKRQDDEVERDLFGVSHAEIGGYLLGLWGLPLAVVQAVTLHHSVAPEMGLSFSPLVAVHFADYLVRSAAGDYAANCHFFARLGLCDRQSVWREAVSNAGRKEVHAKA